MRAEEAYGGAIAYIDASLSGAGALKGKDGVSVVGADIVNDHFLVLKLSDGTQTDPVDIGYDVLESAQEVIENTEPGKLVDSNVIKEVFQSVSEGKEKIASAITDKGVETDATDTFSTMAQNISDIQTGGGEYDFYEGSYNLVPKVVSQAIETKDKVMQNNVTVAEIPFHEVSNETGTTVVIGGIV